MADVIGPGVHKAVSEADYDAISALRSSTLKLMDSHTPALVKHVLEHGDTETDATRIGSAAHILLLEPDTFNRRVVKSPYAEFRSNESKAWRAEQEAKGLIVLKEPAWDEVFELRDGVYRNPIARELFLAPGPNELTIVWDDEIVGRCKARLDAVRQWEGIVTMLDLKSVGGGPGGRANVSAPALAGRADRMRWDLQEAFYRRGMDAAFGKAPRRFVFAAIEKTPPYVTNLVEIDYDDMKAACAYVYDELMPRYAECVRTNHWPGYEHGPYQMHLRRWRNRN